jgi:hypothetical protein
MMRIMISIMTRNWIILKRVMMTILKMILTRILPVKMKRNRIVLNIQLIIKDIILLIINTIYIIKNRTYKSTVVKSFITKGSIETPLEKQNSHHEKSKKSRKKYLLCNRTNIQI